MAQLTETTRFLASADLHLGRSSTYVPDNSPSSSELGWISLIELAEKEGVDAVLLSGDIIDRENAFFEATQALRTGLERLSKAGIHTLMVCGNHDALELPPSLKTLPESCKPFVHLLGEGGQWECKSIAFGERKVAFLGWSFKQQHVRENPLDSLNLQLPTDKPVIALLHGDAFDQQSPYAPFTVDELLRTKADFWLLGHIHKPQRLHENPEVWYPGSPQALSPKESGAHGPLLLEVNQAGRVSASPIEQSFVRYEELTFEVGEEDQASDLKSRIVSFIDDAVMALNLPDSNRYVVLDVLCKGRHADHQVVIDALGPIEGEHFGKATVRKLRFHLEAMASDLQHLSESQLPEAHLAKALLALETGGADPFLDELRERWKGAFDELVRRPAFNQLEERREPTDQQRVQMDRFLRDALHRILAEASTQRSTHENQGA